MRKVFLAVLVAAVLPAGAQAATTLSAGACVPSALGIPCAPSTITSTGASILSLPDSTVGAFSISGSSETGTTATSAFFNSQTLQLSSTAGGLVDIYFTVTGVPTVQRALNFISTFTSNQQNADTHSVIESTFLDNANTAYARTITLASATLTNAVLQTAGPDVFSTTPAGTVSLTHLYQIELAGCADQNSASCTGNLTIDLSAQAAGAPEPATLALLGTGLLGLGLLRLRRSQR